jgi:hypothetical protein
MSAAPTTALYVEKAYRLVFREPPGGDEGLHRQLSAIGSVPNLIFFKKGKKHMVRKAFNPSDGQKHHVKAISACGVRQSDIATWLGLRLRSPKTRWKYFRIELDCMIGADAEAGETLLTANSVRLPSATYCYLSHPACRRARRAKGPVVVPDFTVELGKELA